MEFKKCNKCGEVKKLDEFHNRKKAKDKHNDICKKCAIEKTKEWARKNRERSREKSREWYRENIDKAKETRKKYREKNSEKIKKYKREWEKEHYKNEKNVKKRRERGKKYRKENPGKIKAYLEKNSEELKEKNKKYRKRNRERIKKRDKEYHEKNKEKLNEASRKYKKENIEKVREGYKQFQRDHPEKYRKTQRECRKKRRLIDVSFRLRDSVSSNINGRLKKRLLSKKGKSTFTFLPYTVDELKQHLENLFEPWMSWDNYGNKKGCWNIDHRIPDSSFNYKNVNDKEFQRCWALENLQPLDAIENIKKGNKLIY